MLRWPELQRVLINGYRGYLERHGGRRPKRADSFHAAVQDRDEQPVREFRSFTHALIDLADWLTACDIDTVAMESTGVYWPGSRGRRNTSSLV